MTTAQARNPVEAVTLEYGRPDVHIGPSENESPWIPWTKGTYLRHMMFDVRNNAWGQILHVEPGAKLGKHRHRGPVTGFVLQGGWKYAEYDWHASVGSYVHESPGTIHTLLADAGGMETFFMVSGSLDFFDDDENLTDTQDVFWYMNHYLSYCRENGIKINEALFL